MVTKISSGSKVVTRERHQFIDIARGIGMLLVVLGHFLILKSPPNRVIYSFHMPFFFILSGVVWTPPKAESIIKKEFWQYIWNKTKHLLGVYVGFAVVGTLCKVIIDRGSFSIKTVLVIWGSGIPRKINMGPTWFLVVLWGAIVVMSFLFILFKVDKMAFVEKMCFMLALLYFAYRFPHILNMNHISNKPLRFNLIPMALFFLMAGYWIKPKILVVKEVSLWRRCLLIIFSGVLLIFLSCKKMDFIAFVNGTYGNNLFLFIFAATLGSVCVITASTICEGHVVGTIFSYIGRNTIPILGFHVIIYGYMVRVIECLSPGKIYLKTQYPVVWAVVMASIVTSFILLSRALCRRIVRQIVGAKTKND